MIKNKRILITGATGFIGANLVRSFLKKGHQVTVLLRNGSDVWRIRDVLKTIKKFSVELSDLKNLKMMIRRARPEVIVHTAAYGGQYSQTDENKILETNFQGSVNLIEACRGVGLDLFINTGSSSEYGIKNSPMRESDLCQPLTAYGVSKACATWHAVSMAKKEGLPLVTLRLFSPYGFYEGPSRLIPSVILACLKGRNPEVSSPGHVRDFIFIDDVLDFYKTVLDNRKNIGEKIYNVGSGRQSTIAQVVKTIIALTASKVKPCWEAYKNPRIEPNFWQSDISRAKKELGWVPKTDLLHGLEITIAWFKNNLRLYKQ